MKSLPSKTAVAALCLAGFAFITALATAGEPILSSPFSAIGMSAQRLIAIHGNPSPAIAAAVSAEGYTVLAFDRGAYTATFWLETAGVQRASFSVKTGGFTLEQIRHAQLVNGITPGVKPQPGHPSTSLSKHTMVFYSPAYDAAVEARRRRAEQAAAWQGPAIPKITARQQKVFEKAKDGWSPMEGQVIQRTAIGFLFRENGALQVVHMFGSTQAVDGDKMNLFVKLRGVYQYTNVSGALATVREYEWEKDR